MKLDLCLKCGEIMHNAPLEEMEKFLRNSDKAVNLVVHGCRYCKSLHLIEDGKLRLLSKAEEFRFNVNNPGLIDLLDQISDNDMRNENMIVGKQKHGCDNHVQIQEISRSS